MTFSSKTGAHPQNIQINLQNYAGDDNLVIQTSPVRYNPDGSAPQVIVMAMMSQAFDFSPHLDVVVDGGLDVSLRLPLFVNKFIEKVEMPQESFFKNWKNITHN